MQISRHWRLNSQRYRLEGFRSDSGELSLQARQKIAAEHREAYEPKAVAEAHEARILSSVA